MIPDSILIGYQRSIQGEGVRSLEGANHPPPIPQILRKKQEKKWKEKNVGNGKKEKKIYKYWWGGIAKKFPRSGSLNAPLLDTKLHLPEEGVDELDESRLNISLFYIFYDFSLY